MSDSRYPPDWESRRRRVLVRDNWTCQDCGDKFDEEYAEHLHVHHLTPIKDGGGHDIENLLTICEDCHTSIHSTQQSPPLEPIEYYECARCGGDYPDGTGFEGSYCSVECWARVQAEKSLAVVNHNASICSTCFGYVPDTESVCPGCGNWDLNVNRRDEIEPDELDIENLLFYALASREGAF